MEIKNPLFSRISLFKRKGAVVLLLLMLPLAVSAQSARQHVRQGNKQFRAGNYADAEVAYRKALEKDQRNAQEDVWRSHRSLQGSSATES